MQYIFGFLLLVTSFHLGGDYTLYQWFLAVPALGLVSLPLIWDLWVKKKKIKAIVVMGVYYLFCNAAYVATFRLNRYSGNPSSTKVTLAYFSLDQLISILFLVIVLSIIRDHRSLLKALGYWCTANTFYTLNGYIEGDGILKFGIGYSGFLNYASVNACAIAFTIPFLPTLKKKWLTCLVHTLAITACVLSKSSIPIGALLVTYGTLAMMRYASKRNAVMIVSLVATCIICSLAIALYFDKTLFNDGFRFAAYRVFFKYWFYNADMFFGYGPGLHWPLAPTIQSISDFMVSHVDGGFSFLWLSTHNEYLQILEEHGVTGIVFTLTLLAMCTYQFIKHRAVKEAACLAALAASSLFNFPLRYFIGSFTAGVLLLAASNMEESNEV